MSPRLPHDDGFDEDLLDEVVEIDDAEECPTEELVEQFVFDDGV